MSSRLRRRRCWPALYWIQRIFPSAQVHARLNLRPICARQAQTRSRLKSCSSLIWMILLCATASCRLPGSTAASSPSPVWTRLSPAPSPRRRLMSSSISPASPLRSSSSLTANRSSSAPAPSAQVVLEKLGGGGNGATAGAQIKGKPLRQVLQDLVGAIDAFYA